MPARSEPIHVFGPNARALHLKTAPRREDNEPVERAEAEIQAILQAGASRSPSMTSWLGVSPPTRVGAANALVQDNNWRSNAHRCSHSNLQALREIDARLLFSSPEFGLLGTSAESGGTGTAFAAPGSRSAGTASSCQATSGRYAAGQFRASTPLSCQMGFPVA
ncbi:hypothetical protein WJX81_008481 [Elliptochloris bilobata]|uniref:Uncharacterized protein n=1 Tax=Elliptochloris bilobata TaxID=381761 RepID=A0AAW1QMU9_9CHLO